MSLLFSPIALRGVELENRIVVSPMCQYSSRDGYSNDWHFVHLGSRAVGGAGLIILEASAVSPEGRITPDDLGIYDDGHIEGLEKITRFLMGQGAVPGIQLAHAGRKASHTSPWKGGRQLALSEGGWPSLAPSALAFSDKEEAPRALDRAGIEKVKDDFGRAAGFALRAGFKVLEVHGAHGYLLNEFLSPLSNHRTDEYGGSFENRVRLLKEVVERIRTVWPRENPLLLRISATDWSPDGWRPEDSVRLASEAKEWGVDLIDCSSGGVIPGVKIPLGPGYQVPLSEAVRKGAGIATAAVGLITTASQAEAILQEEKADLIVLARQMLRDPYFPLHAARELGVEVQWPSQYERART